jgi:(R,R)-butanediol dehydrogenase/meso-butanediol dehydrogenase/diacetyl reductase
MKAVQFDVKIPQFLALKVFGALSKTAYYSGPLSTVHMVDLPEPTLPAVDWVKIKVSRCGICTSDISTVLLRNSPAWTPYTSFPAVPGHEVAGIIVETGSGINDLHVDDLVAVCPVLNCATRGIEPVCDACRKGLSSCEKFAEGKLPPGQAIDLCTSTRGGYSPYIVAHKSQVYKIPAGMSAQDAALVEPFSIALEAVLSNLPQRGEQVLVIGGGVIGTMIVQAIRALEITCEITVAVSSSFTGELARKAGADHTVSGKNILQQASQITGGICYKPMLGPAAMMGGFNRVYDCFSTSSSVGLAMRVAKTGGVISLVGISSQLKFDPTILWLKLISLKGSLYYGCHEWEGKRRHVFEIAIDLMSKGRVKFAGIVTHTFRLDEYKKMIKININKGRYGAIKTMFMYD